MSQQPHCAYTDFDSKRCEQTTIPSLRLWCPTWVSADKGPLNFCQQHAEVFMPEHNENVTRNMFFWDKKADEVFGLVERFIPRQGDAMRYQGAKDAITNIKNSKLLFQKQNNHPKDSPRYGPSTGMFEQSVWVVDGSMWLITYMLISCLGNYHENKETFAGLLEQGPLVTEFKP